MSDEQKDRILLVALGVVVTLIVVTVLAIGVLLYAQSVPAQTASTAAMSAEASGSTHVRNDLVDPNPNLPNTGSESEDETGAAASAAGSAAASTSAAGTSEAETEQTDGTEPEADLEAEPEPEPEPESESAPEPEPEGEEETETETETEPESEDEAEPEPEEDAAPESETGAEENPENSEEEGTENPEEEPAEEVTFETALFLGNSRTDGFRLYSGLSNTTYLCATGATVFSVENRQTETTEDGRKISILDAMEEGDYDRIYVMLGINEVGWMNPDTFEQQYKVVIGRIQAAHPDAKVVIQSILPLSEERDAKGDYLNNAAVAELNERVVKVAADTGCTYLNVAEAVSDENGFLRSDWTYDGVHPNREGCRAWLEYLKQHPV